MLAIANDHIYGLELVDYGLGRNLDCLACRRYPPVRVVYKIQYSVYYFTKE